MNVLESDINLIEKLGYDPATPIYNPEKIQIIGKNPIFLDSLISAIRCAPTSSNILLLGETGTGKEIYARTIHYLSEIKGKFLTINCVGIPEGLFESELFGYKKGAFTGAYQDKPGLIEETNEGTLFLDEIGEMSPYLQSKLLRLLDSKKITRIGDIQEIDVNFRLISSTNKDLEDMIKRGLFRQDLYYRINVVPIYVPPLRERKEDILLLLKYFIDKFSKKEKKNPLRFPNNNEIEILLRYGWPGNIRELENFVERNYSLMSGQFTVNQYQFGFPQKITSLKEDKEKFEKNYIIKLLKITRGNIAQAARIAKIGRSNLQRKIKKYNLIEDLKNIKEYY